MLQKWSGDPRILYYRQSHVSFPADIRPKSVSLIVYNLGYLPGGDSSITTSNDFDTTLISIGKALELIKKRGLLSITCYIGHEGGPEEDKAVRNYLSTLNEEIWRVFIHEPLNRIRSPRLYTVFRNK
jgi:hypothetical protein